MRIGKIDDLHAKTCQFNFRLPPSFVPSPIIADEDCVKFPLTIQHDFVQRRHYFASIYRFQIFHNRLAVRFWDDRRLVLVLLYERIRIDAHGTYAGQFDRHMMASGHGSYQSADYQYYEGHWEMDRRHGFGFCVSPDFLKAGIWKKDRYMGERMVYTTERIYGIDISRYQHEQGRKRFNINWKQLRIKGLGRRISTNRVNGEVDYPVSFVYIKSTEGISILNRYYANDYRSCHLNKIPVGAYHFFSTRQDPTAQANHFLRHTSFKRGDLPPMLDIEPSDAMIKQMGGPEILFKNIRTFLKVVERRLGVRPLLYINQRFVNTWLDYAPDLKKDYHFWIARYGEYKPDIHLSLWQLSADGYVKGIQGHVDLNVFNGYQGQWEEFVSEYSIR